MDGHKGGEGLYQISNKGRFKSLERAYFSGQNKKAKKILKEYISFGRLNIYGYKITEALNINSWYMSKKKNKKAEPKPEKKDIPTSDLPKLSFGQAVRKLLNTTKPKDNGEYNNERRLFLNRKRFTGSQRDFI